MGGEKEHVKKGHGCQSSSTGGTQLSPLLLEELIYLFVVLTG